jgi:hypothetical protein
MYADCHGWKSVNIDMILLLVVSFSINLESYVLMTWRQILFVHPVYYFGWARYRAARAYHVAQLQKICFICEWRVLNYLIFYILMGYVNNCLSNLLSLPWRLTVFLSNLFRTSVFYWIQAIKGYFVKMWYLRKDNSIL